MIYRPDTGEILGVHILGLHAADLIHEASNAIALGTRVQVSVADILLFIQPCLYGKALSAHDCLPCAGYQACCSCTPDFV
jgi:hypothetical protein